MNDPYDPLVAAQELLGRRRSGRSGVRLLEPLRPINLEQALAIQTKVAELWCTQEDDSIGAWKAGMPTPLTDELSKTAVFEKVVLAPIFTRTIDSVGPVSVWPQKSKETSDWVARIEPELAFFIAKDLPARSQPYSPEEVHAAVGRVHVALEIIGCRYSDPKTCTFPEMLADSLVNQGLFIGPEVDKDLALKASELVFNLKENDVHSTIEGKHPSGNPVAPVYWLAEFLRSRGQGLVAGQTVITGSYAGVLEVGFNRPIELTYNTADGKYPLGTLAVEFRSRLG